MGVDANGKRRTRYANFRGTKREAQIELAKLVAAADAGTLVEPSKLTISDYAKAWLDGPHGLAGKTAERYRQLVDQQINPHLGAMTLQKLKPSHVVDWHAKLLTGGGKAGRPLSARTTGHAHRVLHRLLARAVATEVVARNVAGAVNPPKVEETEVESLTADQIATVRAALNDHWLEPIVVLALSSGARRGELLALRWADIDLEAATVRIERSLEQTKTGVRFKAPKAKHGRRVIALPPVAARPCGRIVAASSNSGWLLGKASRSRMHWCLAPSRAARSRRTT
jgi:integrase